MRFIAFVSGILFASAAWAGGVQIAPGTYQGYLTQISDSCGASPSLSTYEVSIENGTYTIRSLNAEVIGRTDQPELVYTGKAEKDAVVVALQGTRTFPGCQEEGAVSASLRLTPTADGFTGRSQLKADICGNPCESVNDIEATRATE